MVNEIVLINLPIGTVKYHNIHYQKHYLFGPPMRVIITSSIN